MVIKGIRAAVVGASAFLLGATATAWASEPDAGPPVTWTGFYLGLHLGAISGEADVFIPNYPSNFSESPFGGSIGAHAGFNFQAGRIVYGIEGDFSKTLVSDNAPSGLGGELYNFSQEWRASVRGRLGVTAGSTLFYGTAGWAWAELSGGYTPNFPFKHDIVGGWTVGAGIEHMITSRIMFRVEYLFTDYDTAGFFHNGPSFVDYTTQELRIGVSAKF